MLMMAIPDVEIMVVHLFTSVVQEVKNLRGWGQCKGLKVL